METWENRPMTVQIETLNPKLHNRNITKLGFPRVEDYDYQSQLDIIHFLKQVRMDVIDMDDPDVPDSVKDNIEFTIDTSNPKKHLLEINVKRNHTRVAELKKIRSKFINSVENDPNINLIDNNVLIFYFDSLSRASLKRFLPKTFEWLSQFVNSDSHLSANEFFRYHSFFVNTYGSNDIMYFGGNGSFTKSDPNVFQYYSQAGYITASFRDMCELESISVKNFENYADYHPYRYDHLAAGFAWDSHYGIFDGKTLKSNLNGKNSPYTHWIYGKQVHNIAFEYTLQFWEQYPDVKKMMRLHISDAHEPTGQVIMYADYDTVKFLQEFYSKGYLNDTQFIFVSDHGQHSIVRHAFFIPDDSRLAENKLPLLIHITPKSIWTNDNNLSDSSIWSSSKLGLSSYSNLTNINEKSINISENLSSNEQSFIGKLIQN